MKFNSNKVLVTRLHRVLLPIIFSLYMKSSSKKPSLLGFSSSVELSSLVPKTSCESLVGHGQSMSSSNTSAREGPASEDLVNKYAQNLLGLLWHQTEQLAVGLCSNDLKITTCVLITHSSSASSSFYKAATFLHGSSFVT